jgi:formylmethanofuran dehydrogenase subunit E
MIQPQYLIKRHKDRITSCPLCCEAYPLEHGRICRACQGQSPYQVVTDAPSMPRLQTSPIEDSIGQKFLHDLTEIVPGESKGPVFKKGQVIGAGDLCQLHRMGKQHVYVDDGKSPGDGWVHENEAALAFAGVMAGKASHIQSSPAKAKSTSWLPAADC